MKIIFTVFLICSFFSQIPQSLSSSWEIYNGANYRLDTTIYPFPPVLAEFPGGEAAMNRFIYSNIEYPDSAKRAGIEGKVILQFKVDTLGIITNINVLKGIGFGCDEEAKRIVSVMPRWNPGKKNRQAVISLYHLPIVFLIKRK
ncbi:energy transducer TonB [Chryseobacterium sp. 'Rf worker isolate 10']|uniref:energy transducer TonB n=1 Tax=Chryseobacterium sp. 'Rf worker isolate 10' TaxID=2887348 RepID=UPI003D6EE10A